MQQASAPKDEADRTITDIRCRQRRHHRANHQFGTKAHLEPRARRPASGRCRSAPSLGGAQGDPENQPVASPLPRPYLHDRESAVHPLATRMASGQRAAARCDPTAITATATRTHTPPG